MLDRSKLLDMLRAMYRIRLFEEKVKTLYDYQRYFDTSEIAGDDYDFQSRGLIGGAVHLYIGQEAVAVGACAALRRDDYIVSTHRGHGHAIAKGVDVHPMMAELMGRATGSSHGCGGSMHIFSREVGLLGGNGIVGAGIPIAMGAAFSAKYRGTDQVAVGFFSEGASNQGTFHESLNMAALWKLPVIYICENNLHAASTPSEIALATPDVAARADGYGIPGEVVDGMDVLAVYDTMAEAVQRARGGGGPTLIECKTLRFEGHCGVSDGHENPEELAEWCTRDPIVLFEQVLVENGTISAEEQKTMRMNARVEIQDADAFARRSPFPTPDTIEAMI